MNIENKAIFNFQSASGTGTILWENTNTDKQIILRTTDGIQLTSSLTNINASNINLHADTKLSQSADIIALESNNQFNIKSNHSIQLSVDKSFQLTIYKDHIACNSDLRMAPGTHVLVLSDEKFKTNIKKINSSYWDVIRDVPIVNFNYKNNNQLQVGIIAQHLQKALQKDWNLFISDQNNHLSIKESKLVYLLWAALQEEIFQRVSLEKRILVLESHYETK